MPTGQQTKPFDTTQARLTSEARLARAEEMYDRSLAPEKPRPSATHTGARAEAPGYPPLCAHGMNSLTDRRYDLAIRRLHRG